MECQTKISALIKTLIIAAVITIGSYSGAAESVLPAVRTINDLKARIEQETVRMVACTSEVASCENALMTMRLAYEEEEISAFSNNYPTVARRKAATLSKMLLRKDVDELFRKYLNGSSIAIEDEFRRAWIQLRDSVGVTKSTSSSVNNEIASAQADRATLQDEISLIENVIAIMPNEVNKAPLRSFNNGNRKAPCLVFSSKNNMVQNVERLTGISLSRATTENWTRYRDQLYDAVQRRKDRIKTISKSIDIMNERKSYQASQALENFEKRSIQLSDKYAKSLREDLPDAIIELKGKWLIDFVQIKLDIVKMLKPLVYENIFTSAQGSFLKSLQTKYQNEQSFVRTLTFNESTLSHGRSAIDVLTLKELMDFKKDIDEISSYLEVAKARAIADDEALKERIKQQKHNQAADTSVKRTVASETVSAKQLDPRQPTSTVDSPPVVPDISLELKGIPLHRILTYIILALFVIALFIKM